ncbi:restriction endonuclease subunit S [Treponema berlinense]|uniref:restriction endonuclease subunit S n=1 Tax=Treponema berlinense TaxID=225004 RepID=UPI003F00C8FF
MGDYCAVKSGFAFKSAWWQDEGTKVIRIGDIEQGCLNLETCAHVATDKIEVAKDFIVQGGDLVIAMTGATIGKFSMIPKTQEPILVNQRVGKFFLSDNPIEKVPFIYCTLKQEEVITEFINRGQGSAQPNISTGDILSIPCWIPSKNEIDNFNKKIQPMFETIISNQEENRKLSALRDSLLPKLMNGEIEV